MKWIVKFLRRLFCGFLFSLLCITCLTINSGCTFLEAWGDQGFETGSSVILQGVDSKYYTWSYLKTNQPEMVEAWKKERSEKTKQLKMRQGEANISGGFFNIAGFSFSGLETGGLGTIALLIFGVLMNRHEKKIRKKIEDEDFRELGKTAYNGIKLKGNVKWLQMT